MGYAYVFGTILFTVYGQLILKWRIMRYGALPSNLDDKIIFLLKLLVDPYVLSGFIAAFIAAVSWMAAMTVFDLSYAYPFMSISFVLVFIFSVIIFHDSITLYKVVGLSFIIVGIIISSR